MAEFAEDRSFGKSRSPLVSRMGLPVWILAPALFFLLFFALPIAQVITTSFLGDGISLAAYTALFQISHTSRSCSIRHVWRWWLPS